MTIHTDIIYIYNYSSLISDISKIKLNALKLSKFPFRIVLFNNKFSRTEAFPSG